MSNYNTEYEEFDCQRKGKLIQPLVTKSIQSLTGTNINEALLRAIFILKEASEQKMLDPNSVSLIVLVSDGDPTVGKFNNCY